jgi:hypothetical protein
MKELILSCDKEVKGTVRQVVRGGKIVTIVRYPYKNLLIKFFFLKIQGGPQALGITVIKNYLLNWLKKLPGV